MQEDQFYLKYLKEQEHWIINIWRKDTTCPKGNKLKSQFSTTMTFRKRVSISFQHPPERSSQKSESSLIISHQLFIFSIKECLCSSSQLHSCFFRSGRGTNALPSASTRDPHPPEQLQSLSSFLRGNRMSSGPCCLCSAGFEATCQSTGEGNGQVQVVACTV